LKLTYTIQNIRKAIRIKKYEVTIHAYKEAWNDGLKFSEILESVEMGEIIEEYPEDKPFPSCLIFGKNSKGEPIHSVWAFDRNTERAILITVYRPDPNRWIDWKIRRKDNGRD